MHFPRYWPFVRGIHRSPVNSPQRGQWRGALMFSLISVWINGWVNSGEAGDLRRHRAHYDVIIMETKVSYRCLIDIHVMVYAITGILNLPHVRFKCKQYCILYFPLHSLLTSKHDMAQLIKYVVPVPLCYTHTSTPPLFQDCVLWQCCLLFLICT